MLLFRPPTGVGRPMSWEVMRLSRLPTSLTAPSTNDRRPPGKVEEEGGWEPTAGSREEPVFQETLSHSSSHSSIHQSSDHPIHPSIPLSVCLANYLLAQATFDSFPIFYPSINSLTHGSSGYTKDKKTWPQPEAQGLLEKETDGQSSNKGSRVR